MPNIHIKSAWDHIRRSPFQALAASFVLGVTFFVVTIISLFVYSSSTMLNYFETKPQVIAFIKDETTVEEITSLRDELANDTRITNIAYISKEDAFEIYKGATSDNPLLSELVSPAIFPASLEFSLTDLSFAESVLTEIQTNEIVDQVGFTATIGFGQENIQSVVDRLENITFYIRVGGGVFAVLLIGTSFLVLLVIISMRVTTRRREVEILDLIGATKGFIRSPIILEALLYALFGVVIGWTSALVLVLYSTPSLITYFGDIPVLPRSTLSLITLFGLILLGELLIGFLLALLGSVFAVSRAYRKK